jgi:hypothetical protein
VSAGRPFCGAPSRAYLAQEVMNVVNACNRIKDHLLGGGSAEITPAVIKRFNREILDGLTPDNDAVPGEIRKGSVVVGNDRGAPAEDCEYLLKRLRVADIDLLKALLVDPKCRLTAQHFHDMHRYTINFNPAVADVPYDQRRLCGNSKAARGKHAGPAARRAPGARHTLPAHHDHGRREAARHVRAIGPPAAMRT